MCVSSLFNCSRDVDSRAKPLWGKLGDAGLSSGSLIMLEGVFWKAY